MKPKLRLFGRFLITALSIAAAACSSAVMPAPAVTPPAASSGEALPEEELTQLMAQARHDLSRLLARENERNEKIQRPRTASTSIPPRPEQALISIEQRISGLRMPIAGLKPQDLEDNFGMPRDGGRRRHKGIDIFAPRGAKILAVADGYISYIGEQGKGGRCLWLVTDQGSSFYYAHLDRWAPGIYEGMEVRSGELLGYVGNTGNALKTPPHLHFGVIANDEAVNPYPLLTSTIAISLSHSKTKPMVSGGFDRGGQ